MSIKKTLMAAKKKPTPPAASGDFDSLVSSIVHIHQQTQDFAAKAVNVALTLRNWFIGLLTVWPKSHPVNFAAIASSIRFTLRFGSH